jgi:hypothetical protein
MLLLYFSFYCSNTLFYHAHLINGHLLTHSHPFRHDSNNPHPYESHPHAADSFFQIKLINHAQLENSSNFSFLSISLLEQFLLSDNRKVQKPHTTSTALSLLRAPPQIC